MKQCSKCGESKSPDNFYKQPTKLDGLDATCKSCRKEARASRYHAGGKQKEREYQSANKSKRQGYWLACDAKPERKAKKLQNDRDNPERGRAKAARQAVENNQRVPPWADMDAIKEIYAEAARLERETGEKWHVDHIIPRRGKLVSGLHVASNLQILPARENIQKSNHFVPGIHV